MKHTDKPLVSIIIPCYNGHNTLHTCLDSVLNQTYKNLEIITINDGSVDDTEEIILSYKEMFEKAGITLVYIYHENKGLGGTINTGLKAFTGDYLCWIDCDDFLYPESVEKRLEFLETHDEYAIVTSDANVFQSDDLTTPTARISTNAIDNHNPEQFMLLLKGQSIFCSGCHMIRTRDFLVANPQREIYPCRRGQNWQMLLPVYHKFRRYFLDTPLYGYIIYSSSMSNGDNTKEKSIHRCNEHLDIITHTLNSIDMPKKERKKYMRIYSGCYYRRMYELGASGRDYKMAFKYLFKLICSGEFTKSDFSQITSYLRRKKKS